MRFALLVLLTMLCFGIGGCSVGRYGFLQRTAQQVIPAPDDGNDQKLDIDSSFEQPHVRLTFETAKSPEQVRQWYRDMLVARGWQLASESQADTSSAPRPDVSDRLLAQRHAITRQRVWIGFDTRYDDASNTTATVVRLQFESIGTLEDIERILMVPIDAPLGFLDDSFPGVCWYFFWMPLKWML